MTQRTGRTANRQTVGAQVELLRRTAERDTKEFLKLLPKALSHRSPTVRETAILLITEYRLAEAASLVEPLLCDKSKDVRYDAAESIGILQTGRKSSPHSLRDLLRDTSALVRAQAVESIALLEDKD